MPRAKTKAPEKHPAVVQAAVAQERIRAQKPKPKTKPKKIEPPDTEEPLFPPAQLPTPFDLADTVAVLKAAIPAMQSALSVCERIHHAPWPIATNAKGNLYEQIYNIVCEEKHGLRWAILDLQNILEDLEDGPNQGEWLKQVFAVPPEPPKRSRRRPRAVERS